jgi:hypothetical protein
MQGHAMQPRQTDRPGNKARASGHVLGLMRTESLEYWMSEELDV